jgi:hypothetical protein
MSPLLSHVYELGLVGAEAIGQTECFEAGVRFARTEGIVPAPEPTHAIAAAIREARQCIETGEAKVILTALCGTDISTWRPTTHTSAASSPTLTIPRSASALRWPGCRRSPASHDDGVLLRLLVSPDRSRLTEDDPNG